MGEISVKIKKRIESFIYWRYNADRLVERRVKKSIEIWHRGSRWNRLRATLMWNRLRVKYNCDIYPGITVGKDFRIEHCMCTLIGKTAVIGDNVRVYQRVDIIAKVAGDQERLDNHKRRHAKIGNNVVLGAGCTIIGPISIGDNSFIGARAIVTKDVPPNSVVIGTNIVKPRRADQIAPRYKKDIFSNN